MNKTLMLEKTTGVSRVLAVLNPEDAQYETSSNLVTINNYTEPPEVESHMTINYPVYDNINERFFWIQKQYMNTATEELYAIEKLKLENSILHQKLNEATENIDSLTEALADMIGGAI